MQSGSTTMTSGCSPRLAARSPTILLQPAPRQRRDAVLQAARGLFENGRIAGVDEAALRREVRELTEHSRDQFARAGGEARRLEPHYRSMYMRAAAEDVGMNRWLA